MKHQIFGEVMQEARKMAQAGGIFLELADVAADGDEQKQADLKKAAELLSRAKRMARKLTKGAPVNDTEDD